MVDIAEAPSVHLSDRQVMERIKQEFVEKALPVIDKHAQIRFRGVKDWNRQQDMLQNARGAAWKAYLGKIQQGEDPNKIIFSIACNAVRHAWGNRVVWRIEPARDVMSPRCGPRKGFQVESLSESTARRHEDFMGDPHGQERMDTVEERLVDNTITPPPDQAAFREMYKLFLDKIGSKNDEKRKIVEDMAGGEGTKALAKKYKKSPGRISQMRGEFRDTWQQIDPEPTR